MVRVAMMSTSAIVMRSLAVASVVGAASAMTIETCLEILRRLGHVPSNLANQPELVGTTFLICGGVLGVRLRRCTRGLSAGPVLFTAAFSVMAADMGILVGSVVWMTAVATFTNSEIGLGPLSILFLWQHGFLPTVVGMGAGFAALRGLERRV